MSKYDFCKITTVLFPQDIIGKYNLLENQIYGYIYVWVEKGMYGLVQAGITAHTYLKKNINPLSYWPEPITTGLWMHIKNIINFTLVVYGFGIKYHRKEGAQHIILFIQEKY